MAFTEVQPPLDIYIFIFIYIYIYIYIYIVDKEPEAFTKDPNGIGSA